MHPGYQIEAVYICRTPVDFRKSITGLSAMVEHNFELDPFSQAIFVFVNRHRNRIKVLYWHRNGFCLWYKRLEAEKFAWPKGGLPTDNDSAEKAIRPFVLGRKACLSSDTPAGAHDSAVNYSLVETAKGCGLEPYALLHALDRLPMTQTVEDYEKLLPWNIHHSDLATDLKT